MTGIDSAISHQKHVLGLLTSERDTSKAVFEDSQQRSALPESEGAKRCLATRALDLNVGSTIGSVDLYIWVP